MNVRLDARRVVVLDEGHRAGGLGVGQRGVGAGHVGESVAFGLANKELGDVVLIDIIEDIIESGKSILILGLIPKTVAKR